MHRKWSVDTVQNVNQARSAYCQAASRYTALKRMLGRLDNPTAENAHVLVEDHDRDSLLRKIARAEKIKDRWADVVDRFRSNEEVAA